MERTGVDAGFDTGFDGARDGAVGDCVAAVEVDALVRCASSASHSASGTIRDKMRVLEVNMMKSPPRLDRMRMGRSG
jgi:hypothetical protein